MDGGAGALVLQEEAAGPGMAHLGGGIVSGAPNGIPGTDGRGCRRCSRALHSGARWEGNRQQHS